MAWQLLALARPLIRRYTCFTEGTTPGDPAERIKGFVGNTAAFFQQDGGALLASLPPRASDLVERVIIAFVGSENDLRRAFCEELTLPIERYRAAYEFLRDVNAVYENVAWDEEAAAALRPAEDVKAYVCLHPLNIVSWSLEASSCRADLAFVLGTSLSSFPATPAHHSSTISFPVTRLASVLEME